MSQDKYSVVLTAFDGNLFKVCEAIPEVFGRRGLDLFSIAFFHPELPSELDVNRTYEDASRIASALESYGAKTEVVPTAEVRDVLHRADELWPMRYGERYDFVEIDGMIFSAPALNARQNLRHLQEKEGKVRDWTHESSENHMHVDSPVVDGTQRDFIRRGYELVEQLGQDLRAVYPDKFFVISHHYKGFVVSFWQPIEDAPKETIPAKDSNPEKTWCPGCSSLQPYRKRAEPDAEFPEADWGDCAVCGNEVLVAAPEVLIVVGPE